MILCGLWHSVSVLGIAWGAGLGGMMVVEHWLAKARLRQTAPPAWQSGRAFKTLGAALMFEVGYADSTEFLHPAFHAVRGGRPSVFCARRLAAP